MHAVKSPALPRQVTDIGELPDTGLKPSDPSEIQARTIRESPEFFHTVLHLTPDAMIIFDKNGVIQSFNAKAEELFNYSAFEVIGQNVKLLATGDSYGEREHISQRAWLGEATWENAAFGTKKGGERFPVDLSVRSIDFDEYQFFVVIVRDATARRDLERQLAHRQKMESIGSLAAGIAHEINTPIQYVGDNLRFLDESLSQVSEVLNACLRLASSLPESKDIPSLLSELRQSIERADLEYVLVEIPLAIQQGREGSRRVADIVRAMKEFSHPNTKQRVIVDIHQVIESTVTVSRNEWKYVADLVMDFDRSCPSISCLPGELSQALLNLIVNAAHAIGDNVHKGEKGKITIRTRHDKKSVEIQVADTGKGIPEAIRDRIFDPFFTTKPVGVGTGQGLSISYLAIVEKHGGSIRFETELGKGTTFIIRLPIIEPAMPKEV